MTRGSIRKHARDTGVRYEVVVDLGIDPISGKRRQRSKSFPTKREATAALTTWLAEIDGGTAVERSRQTVGELLRYWLDTYARHNVRAKTCDDYERTITLHITPALGTVAVQKLTAADLQAFYGRMLQDGRGPRTVQICHQRLSQALDQAVSLGLVARNVTDAVKPPRVETKEMETWDAAQAQRFLSVAHGSAYGPIWLVFLATGMRKGEVLGLRWQDADLVRQVLHVRQTVGVLRGRVEVKPPKSKAGRREVPIPAPVVAALQAHRARQNERRLALGEAWNDHDLIFPSATGNPLHPSGLLDDYNRLVKRAGLPHVRIHDLRHTHVTLAIAAGANLKAVSKRVGHARASITMDLYAHALPEQQAEVSDKIGSVLFPEDPVGVPGATFLDHP